ncbi:hypothetical protein SDC9_59539 [bioreactor metagenome]|uniref:Uncharacterized protein n=1 Tax=bioreactor metagenome TaxID=1076179 RepID=A0A644XGE2_9ZZZZ
MDDLPDRFHYGFFSPGGIEHPYRAAVLTAEALEENPDLKTAAVDTVPPDDRRQIGLRVDSVENRLLNNRATEIRLLHRHTAAFHNGCFNLSEREGTASPHICKDQQQPGILTHRQPGFLCKRKVFQNCLQHSLGRLELFPLKCRLDGSEHILIQFHHSMLESVSYAFSEFHPSHPSNSDHKATGGR